MSWSIQPATKFVDHAAAWQQLNAANWNTPLLHPDFFIPVVKEFSKGTEVLAIYGAPDAPDAIGIFTRANCFGWQTFQPQVAPLGAWVSNQRYPLHILLTDLLRALPGFNLMVSISQQDPSFTPEPAVEDEVYTIPYIPTARMSVSGSFEDYWKSRGKNLRHSMKRQRNRLARENISTRLEMVTDSVASAVRDYATIEKAGWKGAAGTAVGTADRQGRFYSAMLQNFCDSGQGLIYRYWYNDRLVATDLCIQHNGVVIILKTTYDEREKTTSPAQLMRQEVYEQLFDSGKIHAIEFYGRAMDWHKKLTDDIRQMYHINYYRWPVIETLHRWRRGASKKVDG